MITQTAMLSIGTHHSCPTQHQQSFFVCIGLRKFRTCILKFHCITYGTQMRYNVWNKPTSQRIVNESCSNSLPPCCHQASV